MVRTFTAFAPRIQCWEYENLKQKFLGLEQPGFEIAWGYCRGINIIPVFSPIFRDPNSHAIIVPQSVFTFRTGNPYEFSHHWSGWIFRIDISQRLSPGWPSRSRS